MQHWYIKLKCVNRALIKQIIQSISRAIKILKDKLYNWRLEVGAEVPKKKLKD